jgi:hypothetical protein
MRQEKKPRLIVQKTTGGESGNEVPEYSIPFRNSYGGRNFGRMCDHAGLSSESC